MRFIKKKKKKTFSCMAELKGSKNQGPWPVFKWAYSPENHVTMLCGWIFVTPGPVKSFLLSSLLLLIFFFHSTHMVFFFS